MDIDRGETIPWYKYAVKCNSVVSVNERDLRASINMGHSLKHVNETGTFRPFT